VSRCGLRYIDFFSIQPPVGRQSLLVAYMGDSVAKELFVATAQRFTGYTPDDMSEVAMTLKGAHLGPAEANSIPEVATYDYTRARAYSQARFEIHDQYLLCCRANFKPLGSKHVDDGDCILALKHTPLMVKSSAARHRQFLFEHMPTYIRDFVSPFFLGQFKCLAFMTATDWAEASYVVKDFMNNDGDSLMYPSAVITNVGLHEFWLEPSFYATQFDNFVKVANAGKAPIKYILHSTTSVRESHCELLNCSKLLLKEYNSVIAKKSKNLHKLAAYLDFYEYSERLTELKPYASTCTSAKIPSSKCYCKRDDGVHFERICNYAPIVTQWDFNWLHHLGFFS